MKRWLGWRQRQVGKAGVLASRGGPTTSIQKQLPLHGCEICIAVRLGRGRMLWYQGCASTGSDLPLPFHSERG